MAVKNRQKWPSPIITRFILPHFYLQIRKHETPPLGYEEHGPTGEDQLNHHLNRTVSSLIQVISETRRPQLHSRCFNRTSPAPASPDANGGAPPFLDAIVLLVRGRLSETWPPPSPTPPPLPTDPLLRFSLRRRTSSSALLCLRRSGRRPRSPNPRRVGGQSETRGRGFFCAGSSRGRG